MDLFRSTKEHRVLLLIGQIIIIALCISYIVFVYYRDILPDKIVREAYTETKCSVENKQITTIGSLMKSYRADFLVNYTAGGQEFNSWVSANGLSQSFTKDRQSQEDALNQFVVGEFYPCWYNPAIPQLVVLVVRHNWTSTFPLLIPSIILVITIYFLWRTMSQMLRARKKNKV